MFFLTLAIIASSVYIVYSLGLSKAMLSISYSTVQSTLKELKTYLKSNGFDLDEVLDGSLFYRWFIIGQEFFNSQKTEIEMKDLNHTKPVEQDQEENKKS